MCLVFSKQYLSFLLVKQLQPYCYIAEEHNIVRLECPQINRRWLYRTINEHMEEPLPLKRCSEKSHRGRLNFQCKTMFILYKECVASISSESFFMPLILFKLPICQQFQRGKQLLMSSKSMRLKRNIIKESAG